MAAIKLKDDQISRIVNAISEAGHNAALLSKLSQLQAEARDLKTDLIPTCGVTDSLIALADKI